jgi:hypothetical protein
MSAPINLFVDVTINLTGAVAAKFGFGSPIGVFDHSVTANRIDGPYTDIAAVNAAGFTALAEPEVNAWATSVFSQTNGVDQLLIGREDAGDADWTATMNAIELFQQVNGTPNFYGVNIESRVKADILEVGAWTQARTKAFGYQTADADALAGTPGNVFDDMKVLGYTRSFGIYHATSSGSADGYLDGAWMSKGLGLNLDVPGGVGIWAYMELAGISPDNITPTQALAILADNGNVYTAPAGRFTTPGITAAGVPQFIDVTTSVDWLKQRTQEAILSLLVGSQTKIPYTDGGINQVVSAWQGVLDSGVNFGHLSPDDPPKISAPLVSSVSSADKAARELTMTAEATLAGAIQKVTLVLNLSF